MAVLTSWSVFGQTTPTTTQEDASGIKLIHRESVKGTVSVRTFIKGGVNNYSMENQGVEELMLQLIAEGGPESMTKEEYQSQMEAIGASISSGTGYDYANISLSCIKQYIEPAWEIYANAIVNPAFRQEDFEIVKNQLITAAKQQKTNPDAHLMDLAMQSTWEGTDYEKKPSGTVESLESLTLDLVKKYHKSVIQKNRIFIVFVGDVPVGKVKSFISKNMSQLPDGGDANWFVAEDGVKKGLAVEDRNIETNYILGMFSAPKKGTEESIHNSLAMSILYDRFFEELRTNRSLSYAPAAGATGYIARPMNRVYISTTDPEQSLEVMMDLVNSVRTEGFEEKELEGTKQSFLTRYFMGQETNASISMSLGVNEIQGSWKNMDRFTDRVLNTSLSDINSVMVNYGDEIHWTYLGKEEAIKPKFFTQPVKAKKVKN
jgi:predicted Zn-dependent peptidase